MGVQYAGGNRTAILAASAAIAVVTAYFVGSWEGLIAMGIATVVGLIVTGLFFFGSADLPATATGPSSSSVR